MYYVIKIFLKHGRTVPGPLAGPMNWSEAQTKFVDWIHAEDYRLISEKNREEGAFDFPDGGGVYIIQTED